MITKRTLTTAAAGLALLVAGSATLTTRRALAVACTTDIECSDGIWCNGPERCAPAAPGADSHGCIRGVPPCAGTRVECSESRQNCGCVDGDGDGHSICGVLGTSTYMNDDCDDHDVNRYFGNTEVCDLAAHDEDCDPTTHGHKDLDQDGEDDVRCCNRMPDGTANCGTDYDDTNPAVRMGSMICDGPDNVVVSGSKSLPCPSGTKCVVQPNRTGVCMTPPPGYVAPPKFVWPPPPPSLPQLPGHAPAPPPVHR